MEAKDYKILLVDDEPDILEFLKYNLQKEGFEIYTSSNGREAIQLAEKIQPHLILLDVMMPGMDGIETCDEIRSNPKIKNILVAFLTARGEDYSQIAGFEAGGDDYITKPIKPKVLVSRIKAILKRADIKDIGVIKKYESDGESSILMDKERFLIFKDGEEIILPKKEFELLALLYSRPQKVFTRDEIFSIIWGDNIIVGDRTIDVHIRKLREKIGEDHIKTVKGVGYKFVH